MLKVLTPIKSMYNAFKSGGQKTARKIYDNSEIVRNGYQYGKKKSKPIFEMRDVYMENRKNGKVSAIKTVFKEKGVCAPIFTGCGVLVGTFSSPLPLGLPAGIVGYFIGHGIDKGAKKLYTTMRTLFKQLSAE